MTDQQMDSASIYWIRDEVEKNTDQMLSALESYFEHEHAQSIDQAILDVHQIYGTLQIVELYAASTLAQEIEHTLVHIRDQRIILTAEQIANLLECIDLIVMFIDSKLNQDEIVNTQALITPLNILRNIRDKKPLEPVLKPTQAYFEDQVVDHEINAQDKNIRTLSDKLRKLFQFSYLNFVKGEDLDASLGYMTQAFKRFSRLYPQRNLQPLWELLGATLESLALERQFAVYAGLNEFFGRITHLLKVFASPKVSELSGKQLSNMFIGGLEILARLEHRSELGHRLFVEHQHKLEQTLESKQRRRGLNRATITAMTEALMEEIGYIKEALDVFSRSSEPSIDELSGLHRKLKQLGDSTLLITDLEIPRQALFDQMIIVDQIVVTRKLPNHDWLIDLATALLFLESSILNLRNKHPGAPSLHSHNISAQDVLHEASRSVLREVLVEISTAKAIVIECISAAWDQAQLEILCDLLKQTELRLQYIDENTAIELIHSLRRYIHSSLLHREAAPQWQEVEIFADVIAVLDQYIYTRLEAATAPVQLLETGLRKLKQIFDVEADAEVERSELEEQGRDQETVLEDHKPAETTHADAATAQKSASDTEQAIPEHQSSTTAEIVDANSDIDVIDPEIIEIFQEELEEIRANMQPLLVDLETNPADFQSLEACRRLAHTIKGSGRVVGLSLVSEPAYALETVLSEHIDQHRSPSPRLIDQISQFMASIDELLAADPMTAQQLSNEHIDRFRAHLNLPADTGLNQESNSIAEVEFVDPDDNNDLDSTNGATHINQLQFLSSMQVQEIKGHLEAISRYLENNEAFTAQAQQDDTLARALHTLKALLKASEKPQLNSCFTEFEQLASLLMKHGHHQHDTFFEGLKRCAALVTTALQIHEDPPIATPAQLDANIEALTTTNKQLVEYKNHFGLAKTTYERWLERQIALFDLLIRDKIDSNESFFKSQEQFRASRRDAAQHQLHLLAEVLSTFEKLLEQFWKLPDALRSQVIGAKKQAQERVITIADQISLGHKELDLPQILNELQATAQQFIELETSQLATVSTELLESPPALNIEAPDVNQSLESDSDHESVPAQELEQHPPRIIDEQANSLFIEPGPNAQTIVAEQFASVEVPVAPEQLPAEFDHDQLAATTQEHDEEFDIFSIFLEEMNDILLSIDQSLQSLTQESASTVNLQELQRDYHTIKGGALLADIDPIAQLAASAELMCERFVDQRQLFSDDLLALLTRVQAQFRQLLETLDDLPTAADPELVNLLETARPAIISSESQFDEDVDLIAHEQQNERLTEQNQLSGPDVKPQVVIEPGTVAKPTIIDAHNLEIIEIFLEEASELLIELDDLLEPEISNLNSEISLDRNHAASDATTPGILRVLHTLKGGARLAGLTQVGDLARSSEEYVETRSQPISAADRGQLQAMAGQIAECLEQVRSQLEHHSQASHEPTPATVDKTPAIIDRAAAIPITSVASLQVPSIDQPITPQSTFAQDMAVGPNQLVMSEQEQEQDLEQTTNPRALSPTMQSAQEDLNDFDQEILEIFFEESKELSEELEKAIAGLQDPAARISQLDQLKRILHTMKGSARLAGFAEFGNEAHLFESHLDELGNDIPDEQLQTIAAKHDALFGSLEGILEAIENHLQAGSSGPSVTNVVDSPADESQSLRQGKAKPIAPVQKRAASKRKRNTEVVRIGADLLERLVNLAGETVIFRSSVQQELASFNRVIDEFGITLDRIRDQIRSFETETESRMMSHSELRRSLQLPLLIERDQQEYGFEQSTSHEAYQEFDTLEMDRFSSFHQLARSLSESASDLIDMRDTLVDKVRVTEGLVLQQARVQTQLQEGLMQSRMVPFSRLAPRLTRMVRQITEELGKRAELEIKNAEGEMDRSVLERMIPPLEHMLRNSLDHGIEKPAERIRKGKNPVGRITLNLSREGNEIVLQLSDDGAGIDAERIHQKALSLGMVAPSSDLTESETLQLIFKPGFSTAEHVTQISGRGVGMDVVFSEIKQLNGTLKLNSQIDQGTQFTIRLPFTVSVSRALMVKVSDETYAIPLSHIEGVVRISPYELDAIFTDDNNRYHYAEKSYEVKYLGQYLFTKRNRNRVKDSVPLILARNTERAVAVQVDTLIGSREIVVKNAGPQLSQITGLSGATVLGDGSVVVILDLNALIRDDFANQEQQMLVHDEHGKPLKKRSTNKLIMVVDDSVTVRKVTSRLLERQGIDVLTAKDGIDAVTQLRDCTPDLILLDIEMPRMDGFEVASHVRHDPRLAGIPIIMISSRSGDKHRDRAAALGVNAFLGKPYQELELLNQIQLLVDDYEQAR